MDGTYCDTGGLPEELEAQVRSELRDRERLLWVGQPRPGRLARQGMPVMLFGIPFTAFALFWIAAASGLLAAGGNGGAAPDAFQICFPLFGVPFVLIGLGMLSAPYWLGRSAKRTCYAVTDRRAILWRVGWSGAVEVRSYGPNELTRIRRIEYPDGVGDLVFEELITVGRDGDRTGTTRHGFLAIDGVREVEELIRRALLPPDGAPRG
jgi:hypothetical protein